MYIRSDSLWSSTRYTKRWQIYNKINIMKIAFLLGIFLLLINNLNGQDIEEYKSYYDSGALK